MIASHYAEPLDRTVNVATPLRDGPNEGAEVITDLQSGVPFAMLDDSIGWAWGYAGKDMRVGYVPSDALKA